MRPPTNDKLCFVCQQVPPTNNVKRGTEEFKVCTLCAQMIKRENDKNNAVKRRLSLADDRKLFTYTLGGNLLPTTIVITPL